MAASTQAAPKAKRRRVSVDLSSINPPSNSYKPSPRNESRLHYVSKSHICDKLNSAKYLSILQPCKTKQRPEMPSLSLWTCTNVLEHPNWLTGWDHAKMEHSVRGIGKFDIALLKSDAAKRKSAVVDDLVGVVEIIHKSPMKEEKVKELNSQKVPWIEIEANASLWLNPSQWTADQPIQVYRSSAPEFTCNVCATGQDGIRLKRIMAIIDIFPSTSTKNQWGCIQRKIYCLYQRGDREFFLIEGNYIVITGWLQWHQINREALLVAATQDQSSDRPWQETDATAYFKRCYEDALRKMFEEDDPEAIIHSVVKWPGVSLSELEASDDLRHLVNYSTINSIPDLYGTIARLHGHAYLWDRKRHLWMKNQNSAR